LILRMKFEKENLAVGLIRLTVFDNIINSFLHPGDRVLMSNTTDIVIINKLHRYGCELFFIPSNEDGLLLDVLEEKVNKQKELGKPIDVVFGDLFKDSFGCVKDFHEQRALLIDKTKN